MNEIQQFFSETNIFENRQINILLIFIFWHFNCITFQHWVQQPEKKKNFLWVHYDTYKEDLQRVLSEESDIQN